MKDKHVLAETNLLLALFIQCTLLTSLKDGI